MCEPISDVSYCSSAVFVRYRSHNANDVSGLSLASFRFSKL